MFACRGSAVCSFHVPRGRVPIGGAVRNLHSVALPERRPRRILRLARTLVCLGSPSWAHPHSSCTQGGRHANDLCNNSYFRIRLVRAHNSFDSQSSYLATNPLPGIPGQPTAWQMAIHRAPPPSTSKGGKPKIQRFTPLGRIALWTTLHGQPVPGWPCDPCAS